LLVNIENLSPVKNNNKNDESESDNYNDMKGFSQIEVKGIYFSSNEKFAVLVTNKQATLVEIQLTKFVSISEVMLPYESSTKWIAAVDNGGTTMAFYN
jgi:hypothetical protein